jgi:hypothetical protein
MQVKPMYPSIKAVSPSDNYELLLTFDSGEQRVFDVKPYLATGIFAALKDSALFRSVHVSFDTVEWVNGADLCPEVLYAESRPIDNSTVADESRALA